MKTLLPSAIACLANETMCVGDTDRERLRGLLAALDRACAQATKMHHRLLDEMSPVHPRDNGSAGLSSAQSLERPKKHRLRGTRTACRLLSRVRSNLLLEGADSTIDATLAALAPHLRQPLWTWCARVYVHLPSELTGTLIVRDVDQLDDRQQRQFVEWLDVAARRVQVISTSSEPLFHLVERGRFLDVLYYRLNIIRVEVAAE